MPPDSRTFDRLLRQAESARAEGRWEVAHRLLTQAERLRPQQASVGIARAHLEFARGAYQQAFQLVRQAIGSDPRQPEAFVLLGNIFAATGHPEDARDCFRASLEIAPRHVTALICLGNLARDQRQTLIARQYYEQALEVKPGDPNIQNNLANVLCDVGETAEAIRLLEASLRTRPDPPAQSNLLLTLHYASGIPPERIAAEHRNWAARYGRPISRLPRRGGRSGEQRLRLGFVSADFKWHPVGRLMEALWRCLDRQEFEIQGYDTGTRRDQVTERLQSRADRWHSLQGLDDDAAARLTRDQRTDVLFDLSGHTAGNRLLLFARKPAPLQVTWFAYPDTTGLDTMDLRITDAHADPEDTPADRYAERLLRLPECAWVYQPPSDDFASQPLPCSRGAPFTFGCLNNPAKVSEACLHAWGEILRGAESAQLLLLVRNDEAHETRLREQFRAHGVADERIRFVRPAAPREFYEYHRQIDLLLDPFPYNGAVTTADALWMGVPVLSVVGDTYVSRQGVSLLRNVGLDQWLCADVAGYVRAAIEFARHREGLIEVAPTLRERLRHSPLMDYAGFAAHFGRAIRSAWTEMSARGE